MVGELFDNAVGFLGHGFVEVLALLVVLVDAQSHRAGHVGVLFDKQGYGFLAVLHAPGGVDAGTDFEDDVAHAQFAALESADVDDGFQTDTGVSVELAQAVIGQDAVLAHDGDNVGRDAHGAEVEQGHQLVESDTVAFGKGLHELKPYTTARKMGVGVGGIGTLGVENGAGGRQDFVGHMMVADDEVDAFLAGIGYLFDGLDAAVEHDDEPHARGTGVIDALDGHAVAFLVAVGDVVVDVGIILLQKTVDERHGRAAVDVVVSIDQNALFLTERPVEATDSHVHILHLKRIVELGELGPEKLPGGRNGCDATIDEQLSQNGVDAQVVAKLFSRCALFGCRRFVMPCVVHYILFYSFSSGTTGFFDPILQNHS